MAIRQIEMLVDGRPLPLSDYAPRLLTSEGTRWSGFLLERHREVGGADGEASRFEARIPRIALVTKGMRAAKASWRARGANHSSQWGTGTVALLNSGYELSSVSLPRCEILRCELDKSTATQLIGEEGELVESRLQQHVVTRDRKAGMLLRTMQAEIEDGCPSGRVFSESLCLALLSYVLATYSRTAPQGAHRTTESWKYRFAPIFEYIRADLARDLTLSELAGLAGLSPQQFCRIFKSTFGISPHQYLIQERVRAARGLLRTRRLSITEIAFMLGFSSTSHFSWLFHKVTGVTPMQYRRER